MAEYFEKEIDDIKEIVRKHRHLVYAKRQLYNVIATETYQIYREFKEAGFSVDESLMFTLELFKQWNTKPPTFGEFDD